MDYFEKRYCPNCGAIMIRKQSNYTIQVGDLEDISRGTGMPLPVTQNYWICPNCTPEFSSPPPGPPPEFFY